MNSNHNHNHHNNSNNLTQDQEQTMPSWNEEYRNRNGQSSQHGSISDHEHFPVSSSLTSAGGALLNSVPLGSSSDFDGIFTFTSSDPLSAADYPQPPNSYSSRHNHHHQLQITSGDARRTWTCNDCTPGINLSSSNRLWDHKRSEHIDSVTIRSAPTASGVTRQVLVQLRRDLNTKMFECKCGSRFRSTRNANYHRKCYETRRVEDEEDNADNLDNRGKKYICNHVSNYNLFFASFR